MGKKDERIAQLEAEVHRLRTALAIVSATATAGLDCRAVGGDEDVAGRVVELRVHGDRVEDRWAGRGDIG